MSVPRRAGYTLIELVVVVLIIGVLAVIAVAQYLKTVETSKADDAAGLVNQIGTTNRMFALDHSGYYVQGTLGALAPSCGTGTCPSSVSATVTNACVLVYCGYLADQDWGSKPYTVCACDGKSSSCSCGGSGFSSGSPRGLVSAARRASTASAPYDSWGYSMDVSGKISPSPASNGPPIPAF